MTYRTVAISTTRIELTQYDLDRREVEAALQIIQRGGTPVWRTLRESLHRLETDGRGVFGEKQDEAK